MHTHADFVFGHRFEECVARNTAAIFIHEHRIKMIAVACVRLRSGWQLDREVFELLVVGMPDFLAVFQHALAWDIHLLDPDARLRLEAPLLAGGRERLDVFADTEIGRCAIELKYPRAKFELAIDEPRNVVLCAQYYDEAEVLDLAGYAGRPVQVRCAIPMTAREAGPGR